jgi:fructose-bisphosphate aldolase class II
MSFWDIPGMKAGVITGDVAWALLKHAKDKGYAIPAFNCTTTSTINAVLEAGKKIEQTCDGSVFRGRLCILLWKVVA